MLIFKMTFPSTLLFREIHKNAWLKRLQVYDRKGGTHFKKSDRIWAVFCVHDDAEPYMELYADSKVAAAHHPEWSASLTGTIHISSSICATDDEFEFVITLADDIIRLAAPTWEVMNDWVDSLTSKLREMRILPPKENVYSRLPELRMPLLPTRDPNSPLPLPPVGPSILVPGVEVSALTIASENLHLDEDIQTTQEEQFSTVSSEHPLQSPVHSRFPHSVSSRALVHEDINQIDTSISTSIETPSVLPEEDIAINGTNDQEEVEEFFTPPATPVPPRVPYRQFSSSYVIGRPELDSVHAHCSNSRSTDDDFESGTARNGDQLSNSNYNQTNELDSLYEHVFLSYNQHSTTTEPLPTMSTSCPVNAAIEHQGVPTGRGRGANRSRRRSFENPPVAADRIRVLQPPLNPHRQGVTVTESGNSRLTLREHQVLQMRQEIMHPGGVRLQLRRKDCLNSIALVDAFNAVWVAGWKQKDHPMLYNALHIGDQLVSVAGILVQHAIDAQRLIRGAPSVYVEFVVRRVPCGRVFALRRESEGQNLGIVLEGNTAEVKEVTAGSIAACSGLSSRTPTVDGLSLTAWVITEVNGRPLNLFFKDGEIKDRLNAVGLDISLLVQPFDLIKQIKKQLKSVRSFKDYIVQ